MKQLKLFIVSACLFTVGSFAARAESLLGEVGAELSSGFDSHYIFRGADLGENAVWTALDMIVPLTGSVDLELGAWYVNPTHGVVSGDELDLYANLSTSFGGIDVGIGYVAYLYPEADGGSTKEIGLGVGSEVLGFALDGVYHYDFDLETHYYAGSVGYEHMLTHYLSASVSVTVGFLEEDYSHTTVILQLPIALTDHATLTPYLAGVFSEATVNDKSRSDEEIFGGVSLRIYL